MKQNKLTQQASLSRQASKQSAKPSSKSTGQLRIIGGKWRGRKLPILDSEGLRPTGDRIRETLFNWLMMEIHDTNCLDLFAGSGALGFEAASRYANHVTMIEKSPAVAKQLQANITLLSGSNMSLFNQDALTFLAQSPIKSFDVVFIDPPFHQSLAQQTIDLLIQHQWLKEKAWIYLETEKNLTTLLLPNNWIVHREKVTGDVCYRLLQVQNK